MATVDVLHSDSRLTVAVSHKSWWPVLSNAAQAPSSVLPGFWDRTAAIDDAIVDWAPSLRHPSRANTYSAAPSASLGVIANDLDSDERPTNGWNSISLSDQVGDNLPDSGVTI